MCYLFSQQTETDSFMTPQEVHRVAFPCNEQHSDAIEKHSEVHGHLLEPEVIINVKQEPQVKRKFTATLLEGAGRIISVLPPPSWQFILKLVHAHIHTHTPTYTCSMSSLGCWIHQSLFCCAEAHITDDKLGAVVIILPPSTLEPKVPFQNSPDLAVQAHYMCRCWEGVLSCITWCWLQPIAHISGNRTERTALVCTLHQTLKK